MNFNFFSMSIWVVSVRYLRISTCQIISTLSPIIIIFFSILFLNENISQDILMVLSLEY